MRQLHDLIIKDSILEPFRIDYLADAAVGMVPYTTIFLVSVKESLNTRNEPYEIYIDYREDSIKISEEYRGAISNHDLEEKEIAVIPFADPDLVSKAQAVVQKAQRERLVEVASKRIGLPGSADYSLHGF